MTKLEPDKRRTSKQRAFYKHIALGYNPSEAAKRAGYKAPRASAHDLIQNHTYAFRQAAAEADYLIPDIFADLVAGTKATREAFDERTGEWKEIADYNARHKFIDTIIKVQGFYPSEKHEVSGPGGEPIEYNRTQIVHVIYQLAGFKQVLGDVCLT